MAAYINENQLAFDANCVGFPELGHCMGIAIEFPNGLYGFHHSSKSDTSRMASILTYITGRGDLITSATALYGSCRFEERYGSNDPSGQWKGEMEEFATKMVFNGDVYGFNLSSSRHVPRGKNATGTAYMEVAKNAVGAGSFRFKRMSKMTSANAPVRTATAVYGGGKSGASAFPTTISVNLDTTNTKSTHGVMHTAGQILHFPHTTPLVI